jgi:hypothetical protein
MCAWAPAIFGTRGALIGAPTATLPRTRLVLSAQGPERRLSRFPAARENSG